MECRFRRVRKQLDELGYPQLLAPECVPLVERLVGDLKATTENLEKYMHIARQAIEERDNLEFGAEPFRCDNAKLVKECNELHVELLRVKEASERSEKELKRKLNVLEKERVDSITEKEKLRKRVVELEGELHKLLFEKRKHASAGSSTKLKSCSTSALLKENSVKKATTFELNSAMALADQKIATLGREVKKLKDQNLDLSDTNEMYKNQLLSRDREIERLKNLLEGGRPLTALNKDCCYKDVDGKLHRMQDEINQLRKEKDTLELRLKESLAKQHEAMKRALHLAERNKHLEKELKDIDQIALQVESECNNTVKTNLEKLNRLQDRMHESVMQIQSLERENAKLKQEMLGARADLDAVQLEKKHLQSVLETALEDKKRLTDRINQFTVIEHDLNMEIDRLVKLSSEQKRKIAELECNLLTEKASATDIGVQHKQTSEQVDKDTSPSRKRTAKRPLKKKKDSPATTTSKASRPSNGVPNNSPKTQETQRSHRSRDRELEEEKGEGGEFLCCKGCCSTGGCVQHFRDLLNKEIEYRQAQSVRCIESLKKEKEYYMEEYRKLVDEMKNVQTRPDNNAELISRIREKEQLILSLQHENKTLSEDKYNLMSRLETARDRSSTEMEGPCMRAYCKRIEREKEILRSDIERLEEERDCLRQRIKAMADAHVAEHQRLQQNLDECESQIRKLESERRELMQTQGSRRANITCLEEQVQTYKDQLKNSQCELNHQRALYSQLKNLHEQTDKALSDSQGQLIQLESELAHGYERIKALERERDSSGKGETDLKKDIQILKNQLTQMDKEKDELLNALDEKTEKIAQLMKEASLKDNKISSLENAVAELRDKVSTLVEESHNNALMARNSNAEVTSLQKELELAKNTKESVIQENRRIQDDLRSVSCDCRDARNELEIAKRQIEDLKRQLQHYVAEVKRTEDILSQKDVERNELLDQFRNLSQEANVLENNNHSLESEATQSKVQLSVALDHAADLEKKIADQDSLVRSYEKQIAELTAQVASLEFKTSHGSSQQHMLEAELKNLKELCLKLDNEKDELKRQLLNRNDQGSRMERNMERLRCECETLQNTISKEKGTVESLEKLLSEARQQAVEQKLLNQDMEAEVQRLKARLSEAEEKFKLASEQLDMYQEKALEYSQQNKQLRRDIANERFFRSHDDDSKRYPSL